MARRGDRASMREGPLAALFRRTEEDSPQEPPEARDRAEQPPTSSSSHADVTAVPAAAQLRHGFTALAPREIALTLAIGVLFSRSVIVSTPRAGNDRTFTPPASVSEAGSSVPPRWTGSEASTGRAGRS